MRKVILILLLLVNGLAVWSVDGYMFRVQLKDKGKTSYTVSKPEQYLSKRAIERRLRQNIVIDTSDLPVSSEYIKSIEKLGCAVVAQSKWLSTVAVHCEDSALVEKIKELDFVDDIIFVWKGKEDVAKSKRSPLLKKVQTLQKSQTEYGYAYDQISTVRGNYLHDQGYRGKGIEIAVIDAGYKNLDDILLLDNVAIKGIKDFVYQGDDILESSDHGLKVFSVMAANRPEIFVGTAPDSKYWLLRSEDSRSEYPIEEDYWIAAAEYADSVGVDIINTSLGYTNFDWPAQSYTQDQLDGKTAHISKAAKVAVDKGIFVEVSAGNEGTNSWGKIVVPADVETVLTVGSITRDSIVSSFSSRGPTADGRIKPDVLALGSSIDVIASTGEVEQSSGTSFAGPVISGLVACLWEAYPNLTNKQLLEVVRKSAHKYTDPDNSFGYGIPDMEKAMKLANNMTSGINDEFETQAKKFDIYPTDSVGSFRIRCNITPEVYSVIVSTLDGRVILNTKLTDIEQDFSVSNVVNQVCIVNIRGNSVNFSEKIKF